MEDIASFYLKNSVDSLCDRLENEKMSRPLIANFNKLELKDYINKHLFDRNYYYYQSKYVIDCSSKSIDDIVLEIKTFLA